MCRVYTVIFIAAIATIPYTTSSLDTTHHNSLPSMKYRRFLFTQNLTNSMCNLFCPRMCPQGYVRSPSGCFLCQCITTNPHSSTASPTNFSTVQHTHQQYSPVNGGVFLSNPCNPAVRHCRLQCADGYQEGTNGCLYCGCRSTTVNQISTLPQVVKSTMASTITSTRPVVQQTTTAIKATRTTVKQTTLAPTLNPTTVRTTTITIPITTTKDTDFSDPCIPSHKRCTKPCNGNYVKGPGGCQYCLCARNIPEELRTTSSPQNSKFSVNTTIPQYLDLSPTSEACILAKVICNQKCDHGFISHPDDCLFCSCQNQSDDPMNDIPLNFEVTLPNPCIQHEELCRIKCLNGYVIGPRDCQFCSCRN
ncbi:uncharacterized protein LOC132749392 [Ruditapes philippinarum]|uniref:uncharacterized protein LOC132749392 n=1 Tax=Ruditapes philippinarum TaxID=129788 RepID=UPI00295B6D3A|nr:uncharacterized protein LOC132749392 [Ruditapes philippinarum]